MSDLVKIFLSALVSGAVSTIVFILGQFTLKVFFDPLQEHFKALGEVAFTLNFYSSTYTSPSGSTEMEYKNVSTEFRRVLMKLISTAQMVNGYDFWNEIGLLPCRREALAQVQKNMMLLTQYKEQEPSQNRQLANEVKQILKIESI